MTDDEVLAAVQPTAASVRSRQPSEEGRRVGLGEIVVGIVIAGIALVVWLTGNDDDRRGGGPNGSGWGTGY